jgi:hypothetical protein
MNEFGEAAEGYTLSMELDVKLVFSHIQLAIAQYKPGYLSNSMAKKKRKRRGDLVTSMSSAAQHRNSAQFDRPASLQRQPADAVRRHIRSDVANSLRRSKGLG